MIYICVTCALTPILTKEATTTTTSLVFFGGVCLCVCVRLCACAPRGRPQDVSELPLTLPEMESFEPGDNPQGCLARAADWRYFKRDGAWFARETNTMPQWAGSCWYYLRFTDTK